MASKGGFGGDIDMSLGSFGRASRHARDIANSIERATRSFSAMESVGERMFGSRMDTIHKQMQKLESEARKFPHLTKQIDKEISKLGRTAALYGLGKEGMKKLAGGIDAIGKSLLKVHTTILTLGLDLLAKGIKEVYELHERWIKVTGAHNMRLGIMTTRLESVRKATRYAEGAIRGLTDQLGMGTEMMDEIMVSFGDTKTIDRWAKFTVQLARGFNLGGTAAGELARSFKIMGYNADEAAKFVGSDLVAGADAAGVAVNVLAKDLADADKFMLQFGTKGVKGFITAAAFARKFGFAIRDLERFTSKFDEFESGAQAVAKLNVAFGTTVNAIDMLLEDDPAKRFETIRQAMLAQGKTFDNLTRKQMLLLRDTTGLDEKQIAAMLEAQKAGMSYAQFQEKQARQERSELQAKKLMQRQLQATAQTLYAFGAAWDRVVVAISNAIAPVLEVFGLANKGGKEFKSFGQVMESVTKKVVGFFNELGRNPEWQAFMREIAEDMRSLAKRVADAINPRTISKAVHAIVPTVRSMYNLAKDGIGLMVQGMKLLIPLLQKVFEHSKLILGVWAGFKAFNFIGGVAGNIANMASIFRPGLRGGFAPKSLAGSAYGGGGASPLRTGMRVGGGALLGASVGSSMFGGTGATIGGAAGGMLGMIGGPIGSAIGSVAGAAIGKYVGKLFGGGTRSPTAQELHMKRLAEVQERYAKALEKSREAMGEVSEIQRKRELEKELFDGAIKELKTKKKISALDASDQKLLTDRIRFLRENDPIRIQVERALRDNTELSAGAVARFAKAVEAAESALDAEGKRFAAVGGRGAKKEELAALDRREAARRAVEGIKGEDAAAVQARLQKAQAEKKKVEKFLAEGEAFVQSGQGTPAERERIRAGLLRQQARNVELVEKINDLQTQQVGRAARLRQAEEDLAKAHGEYQLAMERSVQVQQAMTVFGSDIAELMKTGHAGQTFKSRGEAAKFFFQNMAPESFRDYGKYFEGFAQGGVVTRPTRGLIGEAGPEAVIPLRAMARGKMRQPAKFGGAGARALLNYAAGGAGSARGTRVVSSVADVRLDGMKVGQAIVRTMISDGES